jgi:hypothetical protein
MRRTLLALTLAGTFAAGQAGILDPLWALFTSVWSESSSDAGCGLDPDGECIPTPQIDEGCGLDPNGCPKGS